MKKINRDIFKVTGIALLCIAIMPLSVMAGDFDGSKPLHCTLVDTIECLPGGECTKVTPAEVNLPDTILIDYEKKNIIVKEGDNKRASIIENMKHIDGKLIIQGAEDGVKEQRDGLGWTIAVNDSTGKMVATGSGDDVGFVIFGSCTPE
jgi:hypothetical protein